MGDSQFPALSLDNNPWMKYFSPAPGTHEFAELSAKNNRVPPPSAGMDRQSAAAIPPVVRSSSGKLTRHTSAPHRLNTPPGSPDRSSQDNNRRQRADPPVPDAQPPAPQPKLVKKPSNPLLAKQKLFKSTQSAPNLTAAMRELSVSDSSSSSSSSSGGRSIESELSQQSLYKTELCRSYEETGSCRYGAKCQFAHGKAELRPIVRHPKYKTEICKTWQAHGSCPYGARCRFIHGQDLINGTASIASAPALLHTTAPLSGPAAAIAVDPQLVPVSPSASATPAPRLAVFADIIGESSAQ